MKAAASIGRFGSLARVAKALSAMLLVGAAAGTTTSVAVVLDAGTSGAAVAPVPEVAEMPSPAYPADAPDPDVIVADGQYYAYTTGTTWGNNLGVLTSVSPTAGWHTITGNDYGSTALPDPPSWQIAGTETSPGTFFFGGRYVMFYDAKDPALDDHYCLSVATSASPAGPFVDDSTGPFECQPSYGGSIDPSPLLSPSGQPWLYWKSNDGSSSQPAHIWAAPLDASGTALAAPPVDILDQDTVDHPWETTVENPDMVLVNGIYYLFFSGGQWDSSGYAEGYAICDGPEGPCTQPQEGPILSSYGDVAGPGGADVFQDLQGKWRMAYAAWTSGCTSYSCGGARELYVGGVGFGTSPPPPAFPVISSVKPSSGPTSGGVSVTITGAGFTGAAAVYFGSEQSSFQVASDTEIIATAPPEQAGEVPVVVDAPTGPTPSTTSCANAFFYGDPPGSFQPGTYVALAPERIADTRPGSDQPYAGETLGACSTLDVKVAGEGGVPATGATSVMLNVTAIASDAGGYLTVYPAGTAPPLASNVNFARNGVVPALVSVPIGTGNDAGEVAIYNGSLTRTNVVVDVEGYFTASSSTNAGLYNPLSSPVRLCDTRDDTGYTTPCTGKTPPAGQSLTVPVEGNDGVPSMGVAAVVLNVTAVDASTGGYLTAYPTGESPPTASNVNFQPGQIVANRVVVPVGAGGDVSIYSSGGDPGIVVDMDGYFSTAGASGASGYQFHPLQPSRICDTRPTSVSLLFDQCTGYTLNQNGETLDVQVEGQGGIPSSGVVAVVANVTVTDTSAPSFLVAYPWETTKPGTSDMNWTPGETVSNLSFLAQQGGYVSFTNNVGDADVIVDVLGWFG